MGEIVRHDGTLRIERVRVRYHLRIPAGTREAAERALEAHVDGCPVAQTLLPCVEIEWEAEIEELPADEGREAARPGAGGPRPND